MSIYEHFLPSEHEFIDKVIEWQNEVERNYVAKLTDFLDPREQQIIESLVGTNRDVQIQLFGGHEHAERKRALLYPDYYDVSEADFQLAYFQLRYHEKFLQLGHRDLLGALMSLGIKREKFGDILTGAGMLQFIVAEEMAQYVLLQLRSVGKAKVTPVQIKKHELLEREDDWEPFTKTVTSLRLDCVLAEAYSLSRTKAASLIEKGVVTVNWKTVEQPSYPVSEGDHFSIRGFGRSKLLEIEGKSKKAKWRLRIGRKK